MLLAHCQAAKATHVQTAALCRCGLWMDAHVRSNESPKSYPYQSTTTLLLPAEVDEHAKTESFYVVVG